MPITFISIILAPFVKSIPAIFGYYISKNDVPYELGVMFVCTLVLNMIFFKFIYLAYSSVLYFLKVKIDH